MYFVGYFTKFYEQCYKIIMVVILKAYAMLEIDVDYFLILLTLLRDMHFLRDKETEVS